MRTDARVSKRKVGLPHLLASRLIGYQKWEAEPGDERVAVEAAAGKLLDIAA